MWNIQQNKGKFMQNNFNNLIIGFFATHALAHTHAKKHFANMQTTIKKEGNKYILMVV